MHDRHRIRPTSTVYAPYAWAFMSTKEEYLYCKVLHACIVSLKYHWLQKLVVEDVENALMNAASQFFPPILFSHPLFYIIHSNSF
ncbi:hypothetical protein MXB_2273 [Myxobolus squamalis]|nr:hypothetical protein MXB_2273 [Myxobolus squamalis]